MNQKADAGSVIRPNPAASATALNLPKPRPDRSLAGAHACGRPRVLSRQLTMVFDKPADGVEHLGVADGVFRQPLQSRSAEYAGWVRIVGTWVHQGQRTELCQRLSR